MFPTIYPAVKRIHTPDRPGVAPFTAGNPCGITVHYTASGTADSALREEENGLGYHIIIDRDGTVIQTCYFNLKVNHAGKAEWNGVSPNRSHIAVALVSWGLLNDNGETYTNKKIPDAEIAHLHGKKWHKATDAQEKSLKEFLSWAVFVGKIKQKNICGHDECALPLGRKDDPGGMLSFSLAEIRGMKL